MYLYENETENHMKKLAYLLAALAALSLTSLFGQNAPPSGDNARATVTPDELKARPRAVENTEPHLTKFDLDFLGGTASELVAAIGKAMNRPLNVVIPVEAASCKLPPLKMKGVTVAQLFRAMEQPGISIIMVATENGSYRARQITYSFQQSEGRPSDDTVWYFNVRGVEPTPKVSRFYYLAPYLDGGLTVDDITTAIQTGWRLRGDTMLPALSFHKETKLLIAVGDYGGLDVIDQVLKALDAVKTKPGADKMAAEPKTKP